MSLSAQPGRADYAVRAAQQRSSSRQFFDSADWELAQLERMEEGLLQQRLPEALPVKRGPSARKAHGSSRLGRS